MCRFRGSWIAGEQRLDVSRGRQSCSCAFLEQPWAADVRVRRQSVVAAGRSASTIPQVVNSSCEPHSSTVSVLVDLIQKPRKRGTRSQALELRLQELLERLAATLRATQKLGVHVLGDTFDQHVGHRSIMNVDVERSNRASPAEGQPDVWDGDAEPVGDGSDRYDDPASQLDGLEVAGADELVGGGAADAEAVAGLGDGQGEGRSVLMTY